MRKRTGTGYLILIAMLVLQLIPPAAHAAYAGEEAAPPLIVINEIHYDPAPAGAQLEFVELHNPGDHPVDLSGWALAGGVEYTFAPGDQAPARGYLVVALDPAALARAYGLAPVGPFTGRLSNDGDALIVRNAFAEEIDRVEYGVGFPWPVTGYQVERSIGLLTLAADNNLGGAWRAATPTPGRANAGATTSPPPMIESVEHAPVAPTSANTVVVRARVTDRDGVDSVRLWVQAVTPGNYIRLTDPAYSSQWAIYTMQPGGDDLYVATLPAAIVRHRTLIRYRIEAVARGGRAVIAPAPDDPQPNFALFVNDGVAPWRGAINPREPDRPEAIVNTFDFAQMRALPTYFLIANNLDVADAQFIPPSPLPAGYMGNDYLWRGTLVYDGVVYDHVGFRARGQAFRYGTGKNKWKFNFLPGHRFQPRDNDGKLYPVAWDKLNLSGSMQHANRGFRGEHGVFEALAMRLFAMAGVPAPATHFIHFRVIDQAEEVPAAQYEGDFWGLYLALEELDGRFLKANDLPDGNLYKMEAGFGELNNHALGQPTDASDLATFIAAYQGYPDETWWRANFNLDNYYRFRAALEAVRNYDVDQGKNYFYYREPATGRWAIFPWDADLTWVDRFFGEGNEPFRNRVLPFPTFNAEYQNHLRSLRDLLFNPEQINLLVDEYAALIDTPAGGLSMVDADRTLWDYNPILRSHYVAADRGKWGRFYLDSPTRDFAGMMNYMKQWALSRATWIDLALLTDRAMPATPSVAYAGPNGFPADGLTFRPSGYSDPQGDAFAAIQWRAAPVSWPGLPGHQPGAANRYEIEGGWTSTALAQFTPTFTLPQGVCMPGLPCRVRVRMMDSTGRWSHWSAPLQFIASAPASPVTQALQFSEIMYQPLAQGNVPSEDLEFIELKNVGSAAIDLSNLQFVDGIDYRFAPGVTLAPGDLLVLAENATHFRQRYAVTPAGQFGGRLSDNGETLALQDAFGRSVLQVAYDDKDGWPRLAAGGGASLVPVEPSAAMDPAQPASWRASTALSGSPGVDDPEGVIINEVRFDWQAQRIVAVEFYNPGAGAANLDGWQLSGAAATAVAYGSAPVAALRLPAGTVAPPGGYVVTPIPEPYATEWFAPGEINLTLLSATPNGGHTGYQHAISARLPASADTVGRHVDSTGVAHFTGMNATLGAANAPPLPSRIAITKLRLLPNGAVQWLELTNTTAEPVPLYDPANPAQTWWIGELAFAFPPGVVLAPQARLLIMNGAAHTFCLSGATPDGWSAVGELPRGLPVQGGVLHLLTPERIPGATSYGWRVVDAVTVGAAEVLAQTLGAEYWQRTAPDAFGLEAPSWRATGEPLTAAPAVDDPRTRLCSFDVARTEDGAWTVHWVMRGETPTARLALWRSPDFNRLNATLVMTASTTASITASTTASVTASAAGDLDAYTWRDGAVAPGVTPVYWLVWSDGDQSLDLAMTAPQVRVQFTYFPVIGRR